MMTTDLQTALHSRGSSAEKSQQSLSLPAFVHEKDDTFLCETTTQRGIYYFDFVI